MTLVAFCSGKGSPGVSTLACVAGAVWPSNRRIVIAECDPSGNDLATRFGLSSRVGMTSLVLAHRRSEHPETVLDIHSQCLPGGLEALVGPVSQDAAGSLDRELGVVGTGMLPADVDMLIDCGRILSGALGQRAIVGAADHVVVVTKCDGASLAHALRTLDVVREIARGQTSFVVVGQGQYRLKEIEHALRSDCLGRIPIDEASAAVACGSPGRTRRFARSNLVAAARRLVHGLLDGAQIGAANGAAQPIAEEHRVEMSIDAVSTEPLAGLGPFGENGTGTR